MTAVPLPRQTGRADFPHPALARIVSSRKHSQRHHAHVFQVSVQANALPCAPATLTASAQVLPQAAPHKVIDLAKRLGRIAQAKTVGPASQVAVQSLNQFRQECMTLLWIDQLAQRLAGWLQVPVAPSSPVLVPVIPKSVAQEVQARLRPICCKFNTRAFSRLIRNPSHLSSLASIHPRMCAAARFFVGGGTQR